MHQSYIDELAHAAGVDPLAFQLKLLGDQKMVGGEGPGGYNAERMRGVLKAAGEMSGWGKTKLPARTGMGIACYFSHLGYFAEVAYYSMALAAWLIDDEIFCEGHKEKVIEEFGVDRFRICRLTDAERAFRGGGRFSRSITTKKGEDKADGQSHSNSL